MDRKRVELESLKKIKERKKEKMEKVLLLVLIETMENLAPLVYAFTFVLSYYGPNGKLLGGVSEFWSHKLVVDPAKDETIFTFLQNLSKMFIIDLTSAILGGIVLWKNSKRLC